MEERRAPEQGRRQSDRRFLLQPVTGLLVVILLLQGLLLVLHFRSESRFREGARQAAPRQDGQVSSVPQEGESSAAADARLKLELVSASPEVRQVVGGLRQGLASDDQPVTFGVAVENLRVESATGIGEILVSARLRNAAPVPLEGLRCRLQLRDAAGALLYQVTGERVGMSTGAWAPGALQQFRFLVDNPPTEFTQATLALERLDFAVSGYGVE